MNKLNNTEMTDDEIREYLRGLQPGERVIETGNSCMTGRTGTVYISENEMTKGSICVRWDKLPNEKGTMGTSATWGTRRISDMKKQIENKLDQLVDDFREWKKIYGEGVPSGYEEPKDRANTRKMFEQDIAALRQQLAAL